MNAIYITVIVLLMITTSIPVMCLIKMRRIRKFREKAIVTDAYVKHAEERRGYKGSVWYILQVEYKTVERRIYAGKAVSYKKYSPGEYIPLMYLPDTPGKFKTDFGKRLPWLLAFSLLFLGLAIWFCCWLLNVPYTAEIK